MTILLPPFPKATLSTRTSYLTLLHTNGTTPGTSPANNLPTARFRILSASLGALQKHSS